MKEIYIRSYRAKVVLVIGFIATFSILLLLSFVSINLNATVPAPLYVEIKLPELLADTVTPFLGGISMSTTFREQWDEVSFDKEIVNLSIPLVRFPAGMHAMDYDWESGKYSFKDDREFNEYPIDTFFKYANRYRTTVSYIINVNEDSPDKTRRLAEYIKKKGYKVKYWELGNEAAAQRFSEKFPNAEVYLKVASAHADAIKSVFPDAEFGVCAKDQMLNFNRWNKVLSSQAKFKNIIVHRYHGPVRQQREEMAKKNIQIAVDEAFKALMKNSVPAPLPYEDTFPNKNIWVTEWAPLYLKMDAMNSMAHALWMARIFIRYLRTPEIKIALYWNLNAPPFELISKVDKQMVHRVPFYVYRMVLEQLKRVAYTAPVRLSIKGSAVEMLDGQIFEDKDGNHSMLLVNAGGKSHMVKLPVESGANISAEVLGSNDVAASNGHSMAHSPSLRAQSRETVTPQKYLIKDGIISLPPYAVAVIKWKNGKVK